MDVHSKKIRSFNMSRIKAKNTQPELIVKKLLKDLKIPFRSHKKSILGSPDFYIPELNLIIEVQGCFWHGHKNCRYFKIPSSNSEFWIQKIESNVARDSKVIRLQRKAGFKVLRIWECEIKDGTYFEKILDQL